MTRHLQFHFFVEENFRLTFSIPSITSFFRGKICPWSSTKSVSLRAMALNLRGHHSLSPLFASNYVPSRGNSERRSGKKVIIILGAVYELAEKNGALPCTRQPDGEQAKNTPTHSDF
jgi:hypothetical protein